MIKHKLRPDLDTDTDFCLEITYQDGTILLILVPKTNPDPSNTEPYGLNMVFGGHYA
jgi:hypothetical protein